MLSFSPLICINRRESSLSRGDMKEKFVNELLSKRSKRSLNEALSKMFDFSATKSAKSNFPLGDFKGERHFLKWAKLDLKGENSSNSQGMRDDDAARKRTNEQKMSDVTSDQYSP